MIHPFRVEYPNLVLWRTDIKKEERLKIINEGDFPKEAILKGLELGASSLADSFGICDADEIKQRISLIRFLVENEGALDWILKTALPSQNLPDEEEPFLRFFDSQVEHNPYWQKIREFLLMLAGESLPDRLKVLKDTLESSLPLEDSEKRMAEVISANLQKITVVEGIMNFEFSLRRKTTGDFVREKVAGKKNGGLCKVEGLKYKEGHAHGHRLFSFSLARSKYYDSPEWTRNKWIPANWIGIGKLVSAFAKLANRRERRRAFKSSVITEPSHALKSDVLLGVREKLNEIKWSDKKLDEAKVNVFFSYSKEGLKLHIFSIEPQVSRGSENFSFCGYPGYSEKQNCQVEKAREEYFNALEKNKASLESANLKSKITRQRANFFDEPFVVKSSLTDSEYRWFAISNLYASPGLKDIHRAVNRHRVFFVDQLGALKNVAYLANKYRDKSKELGVPICFPEILSEGANLVAFDEIFPIHLFLKTEAKNITPIKNLSDIRGKLIGLTGQHGGGKTVTQLSVVDNIFLAQSGLPVFGRKFHLNVKKALGMVFIERGEGSTCELLLKKIKNILEEIKSLPGEEVVLILDEIGTGTQEMSGFELGRDLLTKFAGAGTTVLFSTQITSLAEYARDQLGAECFKLGCDHEIIPGIGDGGMKELRKRIGLDKLLQA